MKLDSAHAILDVKLGKHILKHALSNAGNKIPVTIKGHIVQAGNNDGTSTEFVIDVDSAEAEF